MIVSGTVWYYRNEHQPRGKEQKEVSMVSTWAVTWFIVKERVSRNVTPLSSFFLLRIKQTNTQTAQRFAEINHTTYNVDCDVFIWLQYIVPLSYWTWRNFGRFHLFLIFFEHGQISWTFWLHTTSHELILILHRSRFTVSSYVDVSVNETPKPITRTKSTTLSSFSRFTSVGVKSSPSLALPLTLISYTTLGACITSFPLVLLRQMCTYPLAGTTCCSILEYLLLLETLFLKDGARCNIPSLSDSHFNSLLMPIQVSDLLAKYRRECSAYLVGSNTQAPTSFLTWLRISWITLMSISIPL